jgi:nitrate reductase gamma subunit
MKKEISIKRFTDSKLQWTEFSFLTNINKKKSMNNFLFEVLFDFGSFFVFFFKYSESSISKILQNK